MKSSAHTLIWVSLYLNKVITLSYAVVLNNLLIISIILLFLEIALDMLHLFTYSIFKPKEEQTPFSLFLLDQFN